ncbi:MAG: hypothetical protein CMF48_03500 [Legionellales bacterium]|nr:hypothetical protein [Legionellales bacterium]|tara:strand:- start:1552 stop:2115 length:564 start_codon:yes stop_codon:yes gene_type:complete
MRTINLLPWREKEKVIHARQFWVIFGLSIILSLGIWMVWKSGISSRFEVVQAQNIKLKNEISVLDSRLAAIANLKKEKEALVSRIQMIQSLHFNRSNTVDLMSDIARAVPEGLVLDFLVRENDTILIEGKAESNSQVAQFMRNIEKIELLKTPVLSVIQADEDQENFIEFNLKAQQIQKEELNGGSQ